MSSEADLNVTTGARTLVIQSYRESAVPAWITTCMESVRAWAALQRFSYLFIGDELFDLAPAWARAATRLICPVTDIARLYFIKRELASGKYDRVIWLDADVLVFNPALFVVDAELEYAFSDQLVMSHGPYGEALFSSMSLNNALIAMTPGCSKLEEYIARAEAALRGYPVNKCPRAALGPWLLADWSKREPLLTVNSIGLFSPDMVRLLACVNGGDWGHDGEVARQQLGDYRSRLGVNLGAANICHFIRAYSPPAMRDELDAMYAVACAVLLDSQGAVVNGA